MHLLKNNSLKKYHIVIYGCQMNISDAERIAAVLKFLKYKKTNNINKADLVVITMCSVRQSAVDRVIGLSQKIKKIKLKNPKLKTFLTGCILKKDEKAFKKDFDYVGDIQDFFATWQKGHKNYLEIKPKYSSKKSAFVPIMTGCNNYCSYCVVPYVRGREISRPAKEIICEVKKLLKNGVGEIWLLGQNVNSYSNVLENNRIVNFPKLLKLVNDIPESFKLNFLTSHPKDFSDELIKTTTECKKLSNDLHLPIQSGDDKILKKMNRPYTVAQYKNLVKKIRKAIPDISLTTDVIVGFPGETKKQFENTVKTFKEVGFDMAFVNKYSPRPQTAAEKLKDNVSWQEKKRREKVLIKLINDKPAYRQAGKLIVVLGATASGKTDLAIKLAKKFNGEVVSADSRQIYKGMDIGTAKPPRNPKSEARNPKQIQNSKSKNQKYVVDEVVHHLLDIKKPGQPYTVAEYKKDAVKAIKDIQKRGKLPILAGGTGLYIKAVVENLDIPKIKANPLLRKKLEKQIKEKGLNFVFQKLIKLDPEATYIVDPKNPRRVIRALEITLLTKQPFSKQRKTKKPIFDVLELGISTPTEKLKQRINLRADQMIKDGLVKEVQNLIKNFGANQQAFDAIGYREIIDYLNPEKNGAGKKTTLEKAVELIKINTWHFAKRQITWFKKDPKIYWIKTYEEAEKLTKQFFK